MRKQTKFIHWNEEGWKAGICSAPPVGLPYSLLNLSNNLCIRHTFVNLENRFMKLYRRKANLHHYTRFEYSMIMWLINSHRRPLKSYYLGALLFYNPRDLDCIGEQSFFYHSKRSNGFLPVRLEGAFVERLFDR